MKKRKIIRLSGILLTLGLTLACEPDNFPVYFDLPEEEKTAWAELPVSIGTELPRSDGTKASLLKDVEAQGSGALVLVFRTATGRMESYRYYTQEELQNQARTPLKLRVPLAECDFYILGNLNAIRKSDGKAFSLADALEDDFPMDETDLEALVYRLDGGDLNGTYRRERFEEVAACGIPYVHVQKAVNTVAQLSAGKGIPDSDKCRRLFSKVTVRIDHSAFDGSGSVHYSGAGAMARYTAENDTYVEGSFRMGRIRNSASEVLHDRQGIAHGYEADTNYWAGHIGFGHIFALSDRTESISRGGTRRAANDVDVYGKYYHTHMGSDAFTADGVRYRLDSMDSDIMRIGARFNHRKKLDDFYAGLAWDYEFDGKGRGSVSTPFGSSLLRAPIEETDIGGSSVMAEIGWKREATKENPWDIDLTLTGYAGEHGGISGRVYVGYHF